jgi:hypothetical protein
MTLLIDPLLTKKMKIFNFKLEEKLYQRFIEKFCGESDGDDLEIQKPSLDP